MASAYLVIQLPNGSRAWYVGSDARLNKFKEPIQVPLFDDASAKRVSLEFAIDARKKWRDYCIERHGSDLFVATEQHGTFIDFNDESLALETDRRQRTFVKFTNGLGLYAVPGRGTHGTTWFVKPADIPSFVSDGRHTVIESVSGPTPEAAAQRAVDSWGQQILFPDPSAAKAPEQNRPVVQQKLVVGLRPGDR